MEWKEYQILSQKTEYILTPALSQQCNFDKSFALSIPICKLEIIVPSSWIYPLEGMTSVYERVSGIWETL